MKIVTVGPVFLDIDGYGGCVAYTELLNHLGQKARFVCTAPFNSSIPKIISDWGAPIIRDYTAPADDTYSLIDVSDPEFFEVFVDTNKVDEIIDHHPGFEEYWQRRIGDRAQIEFVGAACTLVFERWQKAGLLDKMSKLSARVLVCGILDNTLNFKAKVTTERDKAAYEELLKIAELPDDWTEQYFRACESALLDDISTSLMTDTKVLQFRTFQGKMHIGQMIVWDAQKIIDEHGEELATLLSKQTDNWIINLIDIRSGISYFYTRTTHVQSWIEKLLNVTFKNSLAPAERMWLRKEIIKQDIEINTTTE